MWARVSSRFSWHLREWVHRPDLAWLLGVWCVWHQGFPQFSELGWI